jgi:hypothetical protein
MEQWTQKNVVVSVRVEQTTRPSSQGSMNGDDFDGYEVRAQRRAEA